MFIGETQIRQGDTVVRHWPLETQRLQPKVGTDWEVERGAQAESYWEVEKRAQTETD